MDKWRMTNADRMTAAAHEAMRTGKPVTFEEECDCCDGVAPIRLGEPLPERCCFYCALMATAKVFPACPCGSADRKTTQTIHSAIVTPRSPMPIALPDGWNDDTVRLLRAIYDEDVEAHHRRHHSPLLDGQDDPNCRVCHPPPPPPWWATAWWNLRLWWSLHRPRLHFGPCDCGESDW